MNESFQVALLTSKSDVNPRVRLVKDWAEFVKMLSPHEFNHPAKLACPALSPAMLKPHTTRSKHNVDNVQFGVIDLDGKTWDELNAIHEDLQGSGLKYILYSTWSHLSPEKNGLCAARLCVPFSRPVTGVEWPRFWGVFNEMFGAAADEQCKDSSRLYFIPAAPASTKDDVIFEFSNEGDALDVDLLLGVPISAANRPAPAKNRVVTNQDLIDELASLRKSRTERWTFLKEKLALGLAQDKLAKEGEQDSTLWRMAKDLVARIPNADPASLAKHFEPSIKAMATSDYDDDWFEAKIIRAQEEAHEQVVAKEVAAEVAVKSSIVEAFGDGRDVPYTTAELESFATMLCIDKTRLRNFWIVQKDISYYLLFNGHFEGPHTQAEIEKAAQTFLAPASSAGVELSYPTKNGDLIIKDSKKLMRDYGTLVKEVRVDLVAQKSRYEVATRTLIEAPCPLRPLKPEYSQYIDKWLSFLGGNAISHLLDWLASATRLDSPCAAIYFDGVKGAGKSLFAEGIARLWTTAGSTSLDDALGSWNTTVMKCPLIFGDEVVPKDWRGNAKTGEIRAFIQARTRSLKRKYISDASFNGSIRLILAANNKDLLASTEPLTANDIEAIVDRVLYLKVEQEAADYLRGFSKEFRNTFVEGDGLAKHALWLRDNRIVTGDHRFIVEGDKGALHRGLTVNSGLRSAVCNVCIAYLLEPRKIEPHCGLLVRKYGKIVVGADGKKTLVGGKLLVTARGLMTHWSSYTTNVFAPAAGPLEKAISGLSEVGRKRLKTRDGKWANYRVIDTENLIAWADDHGFADRETILAALCVPSLEDNSTGNE